MKKPNSVSGKVEISYWLSQRSSSANFIAQSILFGLVAIATLRPFFWGGAAAFLVHGVRHFYLANRFSPPSENLAVPKSTDGNQGIDNAPSSSEKHKQKSTEEIHRTNILIIVTLCTLAIVLTIFYVSVLTALVKPWLPLLGIK